MTGWLLLLAACRSGGQSPVDAAPAAAAKTTFASSEALGAHVMQSRSETTIEREGVAAATVKETMVLRWQDDDHWQLVREREGARLSEVRVWEGHAWQADGRGPFRDRGDAEPLRAELSVHADPWQDVLASNADRVGYVDSGEEDIEGRKVWRYELQLLPGAPGAGKSRDVLGVEGQVWIDQATAVRLAGDLTVRARSRDQIRSTHLQFSMSRIGGDAQVEPPAAAAPVAP